MKIKTIVAVLANVFLISNAVSANEMQAPEVKVQEKIHVKKKPFGKRILPMGNLMVSIHK